MDIIAAFSATGAMLGALAAWVGWISPRARAAKKARAERCERERQAHELLLGTKDIYDDSGALIAHGKPGLAANVEALMSAPILNGKGARALQQISDMTDRLGALEIQVSQINGRTLGYGKRLTAIEKGNRDA